MSSERPILRMTALEAWMLERQVSPRVLESLSGISYATIYKFLVGKHFPTIETIEQIARVTEIPRRVLVADFEMVEKVKPTRPRRRWLRRANIRVRVDRKLDRREAMELYLSRMEGPPRE